MVELRWLGDEMIANGSTRQAGQGVGTIATPGTAMLGREPCDCYEGGSGVREFGGFDCKVHYTPSAREADTEVQGRFESF